GGGGGSHGARYTVACEDATDVVGLRHCSKFGAWSSNLRRPTIVIEAGAMLRQFPTLLDSQTGSVSHGAESFSYRVAQSTARRALDTAVLSTMRLSATLSHGLYSGLEADLGGLTQTGQVGMEMTSTGVFGSPSLAQDRGLIVDTLGVVGARGTTGFGGLGVELAGGLRTVSYSFRSSYHGCEGSTSIWTFAPAAEARARGELWLGPWLTAGVMVGASLLERNNWMAGLFLGVHSRAFGGDR
ncbi:MAG TPA: hypothetical protein VIX73_30310, partial [Kofleriaceae bacterium]